MNQFTFFPVIEATGNSWGRFGVLGTGLPDFQREITDFLGGEGVETLLRKKGEEDLRAAVLQLSPDAAGFLSMIVDRVTSVDYQQTLERINKSWQSA